MRSGSGLKSVTSKGLIRFKIVNEKWKHVGLGREMSVISRAIKY